MGFFGGDPGVAVMVDGKETYPLVPVAVGLYSTAFNIFNTALMFPFLGVFYNVLSKIGHSAIDDREDYGIPRYLDAAARKDFSTGVAAVQRESDRYLQGAGQLMAIARGASDAPEDSQEHYASLDVLSREIRSYTAAMFQPQMQHAKADLLASLIEEEDWTASLGETLYQIARRVERQPFSAAGRELVDAMLDEVSSVIKAIAPNGHGEKPGPIDAESRLPKIQELRARALRLDLPWEERGAILTLLGSAERAFYLIERIDAERRSVPRAVAAEEAEAKPRPKGSAEPAPVPAE
jgi:phosphate:Na+ symporter